MPNWEEFAMQTASQATGGIMGLIAGGINDKRQLKQNAKLLRQQMDASKEMGKWNRDMDFAMLEKTSYPWQIQMMKKAGINPALMLGMGGGGGSTTGSSGSGVSATAAPSGGGEIMQGMGLQMGLMAAEMKVKEAQAANIEADTENKTGIERDVAQATVLDLTQGVKNKQAQEKLTEIQTKIASLDEQLKSGTLKENMEIVDQQLEMARTQLDNMSRENIIGKAMQEVKMKTIEQHYFNMVAEKAFTDAKTELTKQQTAESQAYIKQIDAMITLIKQQRSSLYQENMREWDKMAQDNQRIRQTAEMIEYETEVPQGVKAIMGLVGQAFDGFLRGATQPKAPGKIGFK